MDTCKVSIIVPVYKVEQYLSRCVSSILSQTFADFELLLIDDGSPDRCGEICDEWHLRIIVSEYFIRRLWSQCCTKPRAGSRHREVCGFCRSG